SKCRPTADTTESDATVDETGVKSDKVKQKTDTAHSVPDEEDAVEEKFEDAVDSVEKLETTEVSYTTAKESSRADLESIPSSTSLAATTPASPENPVPVKASQSDSYEIESSPEKTSPVKDSPPSGYKYRPGPSSSKVPSLARNAPVEMSSEIVTVDLDDDDDEDDEEKEMRNVRSKHRNTYEIDEEDYEEDDDYYDDPDSDDQDVNRVIHEVCDELNAMDDPDSADDKMDVSSDEDDYSEEEVTNLDSGSAKRKHSDYSEDDVVYGEDEDDDFAEDDDEDDDDDEDVEEVVDLEAGKVLKKPAQATGSMGQISVDDESEDDVPQEKNSTQKVKYKLYRKKLVAKILKRTYKILNRRSMHVMEEGGDVLVCSDAKIVSLKSALGTATKPSSAEEASTIGKVSDVKEAKVKQQIVASPDAQDKPKDSHEDTESVPPSGVVVSGEAHRNEENKENMTVKDATKEVRRDVTDDKVKQSDDDRTDRRGRKAAKDEAELMDSVMDEIDDIVDEAKYQNGSKGDFNDELAFQMDADGSQPDEDHYDEDDDEEDDEEGAVDLSSSYDANKSDREDNGRQSQTDESDAVEMIESSPEKSSSAASINKSPKKSPPPKLESDLSSTVKQTSESSVSVKNDAVEDVEKQQKSDEKPSPAVVCNASPKRKDENLEAIKEPETVSRKRRRSVEPDEEREEEPLIPSKKLKRELECNFQAHDLLLKEYIDTTTKNSIDDVQKHTDALQVEIRTLNEMIRAKENEWNNMIHLKKVKEEILLRLTRKKHVLNLSDTKLGEESEFSNFDSTNLTNVRSASVGPRPPTPPPEVDVRPASVTPLHSNTLSSGSRNASSSSHSIPGVRQHSSLPNSKDHHNLFAQFNHSNSSVTMVPLSTSPALITSTNTILQSRANMKSAEVAREKPNAVQIQRQILPKPILSNHQQILNNLAMSAGLTAAAITSASGSTSISNTAPTATNAANAAAAAIAANNILAGLSAQAAALLNGHHSPSGSNHHQQSGNHLQVGRQGVIKDVKSIIADYRQKHPEQVPRRGRRLKNIPNYDGGKGGSAASRMTELSFLLAAAENSRPSSNDSSQSNSNNLPAGGGSSNPPGLSFKDVLVQFAKMSQSDRNLLSNLSSLTSAAVAATTATASATTNSSSSSQQQQQQQQSQQNAAANLSKGAYPEVTLHPVMNSNSTSGTVSNAEMNHTGGSQHTNGSNQAQNNSNNSSTNSLLHGILTKSSSRPNATGFTSFSPTLARLLTAPERMSSQAATVTSGALANLQANTGLNLSKSNSEITITPVVASNLQQSLLAHQQQLQEQQKQLQRLREQHFLNMDDEADDSVDRLVIDEGDDHHGSSSASRADGQHGHHRDREPSVVITTRGGNGPDFENDVPECQGCKKREAQFVCAGCGNQWYCSRECQVNAWDDHSEVCTG
ncbi:titin homolog, partial [Sabethes cyaneus]|uniref:titin homolog n=1 Tax=Sabethes cyaneus TaxID=53552 RepID=UPI00237E968D